MEEQKKDQITTLTQIPEITEEIPLNDNTELEQQQGNKEVTEDKVGVTGDDSNGHCCILF